MESETRSTTTPARRTRRTSRLAVGREAARQAAERRRVLAEIAAMLRTSPFADAEV
jgi:hypothetical protein